MGPVFLVAVLLVAGTRPVAAGQADAPRPPRACAAADRAPDLASAAAREAATLDLVNCVREDVEAGRWRVADARLAAARAAAALLSGQAREAWLGPIARLEVLRRVETGDWQALLDLRLPDEALVPWLGPLVRGVAAARTSWARQDAALQARARAELRTLQELAAAQGPLSEAERARLVVQGTMAGAQYERDEMQLLLDAAHDLEDRLYAPGDLRMPVILAWEVEADLLRITDRYAAASERYLDVLVQWPRRVQACIGLALAHRRLGHRARADEALAQARALWADADPEALAMLK